MKLRASGTTVTARVCLRAVMAISLLLPVTPGFAGLADIDLSGTNRVTPQATMGALEVAAAAPASPSSPGGLFLTMQRVNL